MADRDQSWRYPTGSRPRTPPPRSSNTAASRSRNVENARTIRDLADRPVPRPAAPPRRGVQDARTIRDVSDRGECSGPPPASPDAPSRPEDDELLNLPGVRDLRNVIRGGNNNTRRDADFARLVPEDRGLVRAVERDAPRHRDAEDRMSRSARASSGRGTEEERQRNAYMRSQREYNENSRRGDYDVRY